MDQQAQEYFSQTRNHKKEILKFIRNINHLAPLTVKLKISAIRIFFMEQGLEFKKAFWKKVNRQIRGSKAVTLDMIWIKDESLEET